MGAANPPPSKGRLACNPRAALFLLCCYDKPHRGDSAGVLLPREAAIPVFKKKYQKKLEIS
jgi:hypothetical protein